MKKTVSMLHAGFESSSGTTPEFKAFVSTFKREFTKELKTVGATDIVIKPGHFYVSGFYTVKGQVWYVSVSDVRGGPRALSLLYRTAKDYKDFSGGSNQYVNIETGMTKRMHP